jgi:hypothetical protein
MIWCLKINYLPHPYFASLTLLRRSGYAKAQSYAQRRRRSVAEALERRRQAYGGRWKAKKGVIDFDCVELPRFAGSVLRPPACRQAGFREGANEEPERSGARRSQNHLKNVYDF